MVVYRESARWARLLERGDQEQLSVTRLKQTLENQADGLSVYLVSSSKKDGSHYIVELHEGFGSTAAVCSCLSGQNSAACKHAALAVRAQRRRALRRVA